MTTIHTTLFNRIDWVLLREQKKWLLGMECDEAQGLANLIDAIQDAAVSCGGSEFDVFGTDLRPKANRS